MTDTKAVMQQALKALTNSMAFGTTAVNQQRVIEALRAAIAQPEQPIQEPAAWMKTTNAGGDWDAYDFSANQWGDFQTPLYRSPQVAQPEQPGLAERIQREIDHCVMNDTRLVPNLGKMKGDLAVRAAYLEAILETIAQLEQPAPRGTDAQILKEREITTSAIVGAMAYGFQNGEYPPDDSAWLRPFWEMGRHDAKRQALIAQPKTVNARLLKAFRAAVRCLDSPFNADVRLVLRDSYAAIGAAELAQPEQQTERNFCAHCGKRLSGDGIHTCTPPKDKQ